MRIGVTDTMSSEDKFNFYVKWIKKDNPDIIIVKLSYKLDNLREIDQCQGIIITGGNDVNPRLYNGNFDHPKIKDVDPRRDDFEYKVLDKILTTNKPCLSICRGMQLANVYFGGTLIPDIEDAGYKSHKTVNGKENQHMIFVESNSFLYKITGSPSGKVNSHHHQAVDKPGHGLRVTAKADDGIIEAMEMDIPFGLLVQWHPERMKDFDNPFAGAIKERFLLTIYHSIM